MAVRYKPDHRGIDKMLLSREFFKMTGDFAEAGQRYAQDISPRDTGDYRDSFRVEEGHTVEMFVQGHHTIRAAARLVNDSDHAAHVEWQWGHYILARTVDYIERAVLING